MSAAVSPANASQSDRGGAAHEAVPWHQPDTPLRLRTKFAFALVTGLGGMLLGTASDTESLSIIIVTFSLIGFICVDWQKLFALPSLVAYAAMALTAFVCVAEFMQDSDQLGRKMVAVAQLLAVAQAILMLQEKTHRLFEQLLIFALLNCVVAAVFNDAFNYAIWFIPLTIMTGLALAFLAADETATRAVDVGKAANTPVTTDGRTQRLYALDNGAATRSITRVALGLPWTSVILLVPAVTVIAATIFFALPRRIDARRGASTEALVGFSGSVQLGQIGRMQMSKQRALRVKFVEPDKNQPYSVVGGIYLRGRTLEQYVADREVADGGGTWQTVPVALAGPTQALPVRYVPNRTSDQMFFDRVHVEVHCESMRTPDLFAVAPYHRIIGSEGVVNLPNQWCITRLEKQPSTNGGGRFPRKEYFFGTQAFRDGVQSAWIHDLSLSPIDPLAAAGRQSIMKDEDLDAPDAEVLVANQLEYLDRLLQYSEQIMPSARQISDEIISKIPAKKRTPVEIARQLERDLQLNSHYEYTLDGGIQPILGMDPIEQFLSIDRRGHCQYFASALAMMLRSQGIPARLVVGYHCDEFSELGQYFIVRQSHAHAWVEALIDAKDLPFGQNVYGQPRSRRYWLRLDPTPGGGGVIDDGNIGGGRQLADLAQNLWTDYIIEMDPATQETTLLSTPAFAPMTNSYRTWIEQAKSLALKINAGEVQGIGGGKLFSTNGAIIAIAIGFAAVIFVKLQFPNLYGRRRRATQAQRAARPSIPFYAEALELLEQAGYARSPGQTPAELTASLPADGLRSPTDVLTQLFYRIRYGSGSSADSRGGLGGDRSESKTMIEQSLDQIRRALPQHRKPKPTEK
ncbi:transglutaminase TgpA family protein [Aporhodopirellula aestuarii]|uniref:DUF3488 and transglutaminase-like domain-containing protein n=1 Tax=Aporhodopirellula aestuarii TaxID=2950107 RepID=A0ABT0U5F4_9BACT|nr:DUF3488 and transglutaminase-like domain-containing protein [Aporhodopirellula aestuarii]MCM2372032.1 DUF3488 and transglutaminase-like domain-containing protein [Aporhodopirellula aestuarii]